MDIFLGWLTAAVIGCFGLGYPGDACIAGAACGIGVVLTMTMGNTTPLFVASSPGLLIFMKFSLLPMVLSTQGGQNLSYLSSSFFTSKSTIIGLSTLSIVVLAVLFFCWLEGIEISPRSDDDWN
ncbi:MULTISPECIES: hypothetical protein [Herbaspirillum]|uniref:Uncharacterized protein n=2 Tax=Herbaspirillum huttiense TaxID=863372 RepID=A0AAJ2HAI3_9BURK|nr:MULTISPECIES: hypothetical protein [Herbaspirillum]MDR9836921.1 hypothetical protein [Herbaspirillum huttiense]